MKAAHRSHIESVIAECLAIGPIASISKAEKDKGYIIRHPGDEPWFPIEEWDNSIISMDGSRVRILMIRARDPGKGAFSRMITGILREGLTPVVICPLTAMECILRLWNWHHHFSAGSFFERESVWLPTKKWKEERRK